MRITGTPSCAITELSRYSISEWTMLSRCTTTSMSAGSMSKSHFASINSRPLFISVELSIVTFAPISQFGCFSASAGRTLSSAARSLPKNGPPDAVSITRLRSDFVCMPCRH